MDAVEFYRQFARYCTNSYCGACNIVDYCKTKTKDGRDAEKIVREIEQWAKDHPVKTRQSEFLKMFPDANMSHIEECFCVRHFDNAKICEFSVPTGEMCKKCRYKFWNEEVTE